MNVRIVSKPDSNAGRQYRQARMLGYSTSELDATNQMKLTPADIFMAGEFQLGLKQTPHWQY